MTAAQQVYNWLLNQRKVIVPDDWLQACIEWIVAENQGSRPSNAALCKMVLEQWLISDLRDVGASCLPADCSQQTKLNLTGNFCLQVDSVIDASTPYYSQLQALEGTENANVQVTATQFTQTQPVKANRMLMMDMTDGSQDIKGMEYQPIPELSDQMTPGLKVLIQGPVVCRRGVIMLTRKNIAILGGEVDSIREGNQPVRVVQRKLAEQSSENRPQRELPRMKFESKPVVKKEKPQDKPTISSAVGNHSNYGHRSTLMNQPKTSQHTACDMEDDFLDGINPADLDALEEQWDQDDLDLGSVMDEFETESNIVASSNIPQSRPASNIPQSRPAANIPQSRPAANIPQSRPTANIPQSRPAANIPQSRPTAISHSRQSSHISRSLIHPESTTHQTSTNQKHDQTGASSVLDDPALQFSDDGDDFEDMAVNLQPTSANRRVSVTSPTEPDTKRQRLNSRKTASVMKQEGANDQQQCLYIKTEEKEDSTPMAPAMTIGLHTAPYTYLKHVTAALPSQTQQLIRVKAYVVTLLSKLDHNSGRGWSLMVKLSDGTAAVDVNLSDQFLSSLIGFSSQECETMKGHAKTNKQIRVKLSMGMKQCQQCLIQLSGLLHLQLDPGQPRPTVLRQSSFTQQDILALQRRSSPS